MIFVIKVVVNFRDAGVNLIYGIKRGLTTFATITIGQGHAGVARNVKRWRAGNHALRWTATGLLEAEKKFRKVKGYRELELLQSKLNPSLTQQVQVA